MFEKVLVANRGEIACRVIATLRRMGVGSVAIYTDADAGSLHVTAADEAVRVGDGPAASSYLDHRKVIDACIATGAQAVHPGYGFLSENVTFAAACVAAGISWIGPDPDHVRAFGDKHTARMLAAAAGVPTLAGSALLDSAAAALEAAGAVGYPVMMKATAGGGGIGMQRCASAAELAEAYETVTRLAGQHFGGGGVYLERFVERARHVEVQLFGTSVLGVRDCSAQRRHQKVIEESPPVGLPAGLEEQLCGWAGALAASVGYRSAGTVEFVVDAERGDAAFLEVNTRLQVEHGVTELLLGVDLVEWMVRDAAGEPLPSTTKPPGGAAIEARVYAEDPAHGDRPGIGTLVDVAFPPGARVDTWVTTGTEVTPWYDPLLAKILVRGASRAEAVAKLREALAATRLDGVATNLAFLRDVVASAGFVTGGYPTSFLPTVHHRPAVFEVIEPGMQTTVQDHPGRLGYWKVGIPPSGPMDDLAHRRANALVCNDPGAAALEIAFTGPTVRFEVAAVIALAGAPMGVWVDDVEVAWDAPVAVAAGATVRVGAPRAGGCRAYLAVAGGVAAPLYLGSRSTFMLGRFGGHGGRSLIAGDVVGIQGDVRRSGGTANVAAGPPHYGHEWTLTVTDGPHGAPDFFTDEGIDELFAAAWTVHHHSDRTGIRLIGPTPRWARADGGEAGLHPSNIHDTVYAVGTVDFTGDMPVILGPDGPSLGGFVCPLTVTADDRWKLGQLTAGDTVRFVRAGPRRDPVIRTRGDVTYRRAGDRNLLVEFGPNVLDLELRLRAHALMTAVERAAVPGIDELAPGIRSLQVRYDPETIGEGELVAALEAAPDGAPDEVPSRIVHLPLSWDDPATRTAIERYMQVVRDDAPWCPWNIEFIRRINGLDSVDDVKRIVFDASYLVLGLGDVYLGAPVATPLDPRHRLVTTKYNPARTWTAENSVGIGGAYLCVYGMEGPGGYQFVGRTIQMWNPYRETADFSGRQRWLLRFFDQLRFFPVSAEELLDLRRDFAVGRYTVDITETTLSLAEHRAFLAAHAAEIATAKERQQRAFEEERGRWERSGELTRSASAGARAAAPFADRRPVPAGMVGVTTPVHGVVARVAGIGDRVAEGQTVVVVEAMKTETSVPTPVAGEIADVRCETGGVATPGEPLVVVAPG